MTTSPASPDAKLERLLGGPALASLRQRLRRYCERRADGQAGDTLTLAQLNPVEQDALALLTGRPVTASRSARIDVARLDANLRAASVADSLRDALERIDGPIIQRAAQQTAAQSAWSTICKRRDGDARLQGWLRTPAASTLLKRLTRQDVAIASSLLTQANAVLSRLPIQGMARAQLAAQVLGNAHSLDSGQPIATIVLAAWRHAESSAVFAAEDIQDGSEGMGQPETRPPEERVRDTWARAGVLVNELARPALMLNLPVRSPTDACWRLGEPAYLSLRQLLRSPPSWSVTGVPVFICENPNLLAIAADQLGPECSPLVCTDGMPAAAQRTLLTQLMQAGADLRYHGDFDWPGLQIANYVLRTWQAQPWRLASTDYEAAAQSAPHLQRDLSPANTVALWDPLLTPAMNHHGRSIAEEAVADSLLKDLRPT